MSLRALHRASAIALALFIGFHLFNHGLLFAGVKSHIAFMDALRPYYRGVLGHGVLLALIVWQMGSGAVQLWRGRGRRSGFVARAQAVSGAYLLLFLAVHVSAVLSGRSVGVDTNIYFAIAGYYNGMAWFFVPYYWLAIAALFTHLGCAAYWNIPASIKVKQAVLFALMAIGVLFATALTAYMAGWATPITVPDSYLNP